jgi:protein-S-isoprenylcysteine O-methyltransferase Ste14
MKNSQKKNIGIALVVLGAVLMILATVIPALGDLLDQNIYTSGSAFLVIAGIIVHIWLNKKLPLDDEPEDED